jgi:G:T/U-mismatch repair DNA glycosylase
MITIKHKFRNFRNQPDIETLILGTFNPDTPGNKAEFFYGRGKNYLWNILPKVFSQPGLKTSTNTEKIDFIVKNKIGFTDIIRELIVESGFENKYADDFIDNKVSKWIDFELFLSDFPKINKVFFTRKTFTDIPKIKKQIDQIKQICQSKNIGFFTLPTPSRFENQAKIHEWKAIFNQ